MNSNFKNIIDKEPIPANSKTYIFLYSIHEYSNNKVCIIFKVFSKIVKTY